MGKPKKPSVRETVKEAKAAGLDVTSRGVNLSALNAASSTPINLSGVEIAQAAKWQRLPPDVSESEWSKRVKDFAVSHGWTCYHTRNSIGSDPGFPDWVMAKVWENGLWASLIFTELKDEDGVQSEAQKLWETLLRKCGQQYYLWRPSHWEEVQRILSQ